jgi:hypothetical protein
MDPNYYYKGTESQITANVESYPDLKLHDNPYSKKKNFSTKYI